MAKVALGQVLLFFGFCPVNMTPSLFHIYTCIIWLLTMGLLAAAVPQRHSLTLQNNNNNGIDRNLTSKTETYTLLMTNS
jgi:hypothetical protein